MNEQDTFDALRRIPYHRACAIYTIEGFALGTSASREQLTAAIDPVLKPLGWSVDALYQYSEEHPDD